MKDPNTLEQNKFPSFSEINRSFNANSADDFMHSMQGYSYVASLGDQFATYCLPKYQKVLFLTPEIADINIHWKIHLSCHYDDLAKMWEIVTPILIRHQCSAFKCSKTYNLGNATTDQRTVNNMQITIYVIPGDEERHNSIIEEIEQALLKNNITPAQKIHESDKQIGLYTSIRFSGYGNPLRYISEEKAAILCVRKKNLQRYNPVGVKDPFKGISYNKRENVAKIIAKERGYAPGSVSSPELVASPSRDHIGKKTKLSSPDSPRIKI